MATPEPSTPIGHVIGLKAPRARVEYAPPASLVRRMLAEYGRAQIYEWYQATTLGKVVFDVDGKASHTTPQALLLAALAGVDTFFGHPFPRDRIVIASSHGGDKLSFRIFVPGFRMLMADIKARIVRLGLDKNRPFDAAIYGATQKLRMVGSIKTPEDARPLILSTLHGKPVDPTKDLLLDTIVQVTHPDWPLLTENDTAAPSLPCKRKAPETTVEKAPEEAGEAAEGAAPTTTTKRGRKSKEDTLPHHMRRALEDVGFVNVRSSARRARGYNFTADNRDRCPVRKCGRAHDSNQWWCVEKEDAFLVSSYSDHCPTQRIEKHMETITPVATGPLDCALADIHPEMAAFAKALTPATHMHCVIINCPKEHCLSCKNGVAHCAPHDYRVEEIMKREAWSLQHVGPDSRCPGAICWASATFLSYVEDLAALSKPRACQAAMSELFVRAHEGVISITPDGHRIMHFCGTQQNAYRDKMWRRRDPGPFKSYVGTYLRGLMQKVTRMEQFQEREMLAQVRDYLQESAAISCIVENIKGLYGLLPQPEFDADPYLIGCDNCVIDLSGDTYVVREPRLEDYVTLSTGYDFPDELPGGERDSLATMMEQIYPVAEEREIVQRFLGYSLLGNHPQVCPPVIRTASLGILG